MEVVGWVRKCLIIGSVERFAADGTIWSNFIAVIGPQTNIEVCAWTSSKNFTQSITAREVTICIAVFGQYPLICRHCVRTIVSVVWLRDSRYTSRLLVWLLVSVATNMEVGTIKFTVLSSVWTTQIWLCNISWVSLHVAIIQWTYKTSLNSTCHTATEIKISWWVGWICPVPLSIFIYITWRWLSWPRLFEQITRFLNIGVEPLITTVVVTSWYFRSYFAINNTSPQV